MNKITDLINKFSSELSDAIGEEKGALIDLILFEGQKNGKSPTQIYTLIGEAMSPPVTRAAISLFYNNWKKKLEEEE